MQQTERNFAFIDSQNLNLGIQLLGWKLNWARFLQYLKEKYSVTKAYVFVGYMPENQALYTALQEAGFVLIFKPTLQSKEGVVKGNVDAELVLQAMIDYPKYDQAVIVTSDGDFACLVDHLYQTHKLKIVLSPNYENCSVLLRRAAREKIYYMDNLRRKLEYRHKKKAPPEDGTSGNALVS